MIRAADDDRDVTALRVSLGEAERDWSRLDAQADRSAAVKSVALVQRIQGLRAAIARAERDCGRTGGGAV